MGAPGAEAGLGGDDPVALGEAGLGRAGGEDLEDALVAGDGGGRVGAEVGGEGRRGAVGALDGVDVGGVDGGGEGADEDGGGGDGGRDGVLVEAARGLALEARRRERGRGRVADRRASFGSPLSEKTRAFACV